jgi:predicted PhzF superfamily epimerase YddE/YHI9
MRIPIYHVDAFTDTVFAGNPAAVCILDSWPDDDLLQNIAFENSVSETAFLVGQGSPFQLRWFTPTMEVDLCGHATLATAFVCRKYRGYTHDEISFSTKSGPLAVSYGSDLLTMVFPRRPGERCDVPDRLITGLGAHPLEVLKSRDYMAVFDGEDDVRNLAPLFEDLRLPDCLGVIATAPGRDVDFVSRFFVPNGGVDEDPVTGSAHSTLIPYWSARLKKDVLTARQLSKRGGSLWCEDRGDSVTISGRVVGYLSGVIDI